MTVQSVISLTSIWIRIVESPCKRLMNKISSRVIDIIVLFTIVFKSFIRFHLSGISWPWKSIWHPSTSQTNSFDSSFWRSNQRIAPQQKLANSFTRLAYHKWTAPWLKLTSLLVLDCPRRSKNSHIPPSVLLHLQHNLPSRSFASGLKRTCHSLRTCWWVQLPYYLCLSQTCSLWNRWIYWVWCLVDPPPWPAHCPFAQGPNGSSLSTSTCFTLPCTPIDTPNFLKLNHFHAPIHFATLFTSKCTRICGFLHLCLTDHPPLFKYRDIADTDAFDIAASLPFPLSAASILAAVPVLPSDDPPLPTTPVTGDVLHTAISVPALLSRNPCAKWILLPVFRHIVQPPLVCWLSLKFLPIFQILIATSLHWFWSWLLFRHGVSLYRSRLQFSSASFCGCDQACCTVTKCFVLTTKSQDHDPWL